MSTDLRSKRDLVQQAFEHAALGTILAGIDGRALAVNPAACRMLGYNEAELLEVDLQTITHPDDAEVDVCGLQDLLAGHVESFTVVKRYLRKSGGTTRVLQTVSLARDRRAHPRFFVSQLRDVTTERRVERQNDILFRLSPDMLAVAPPDLHCLERVNPAWERTVGWTPRELAEHPLLDYVHPQQRERIGALFGQPAADAGSMGFRAPFRCKDGEYRWLEWNTYLGEGHRYCVVRDVSRREEVEQALRTACDRLRAQELQLSSVVDNIGDGLLIFDAAGRVHLFNAAAERMFGYTAEQLVGGSIEVLLTEGLREARHSEMEAHLHGGEPELVGKGKAVLPVLRRDGTEMHVELVVNALPGVESDLFVAVMRDVTRSRNAALELLTEKERLRVTLESIGDGVIATDTAGRVTYLNPVAERMTGWTIEEADGQPASKILVLCEEGASEPPPSPIDIVLREQRVVGLAEDMILERRGGGRFAIEDSAAPIMSGDDELIGAVMVFHDVSDARRIAAEMTHQASHDPLTGLVNRRGFERRLDAVLRREGESREGAVLFMDLDQFKLVNDTCGHASGDELLRRLGAVFRKRLRQGDTLARLGGDEFGVILEDCPPENARRIAESLRQAVAHFTFEWDGHTFHVGVSIGVVVLGAELLSRDEVLRRADAACYLAKDRGRNRIHVYRIDDRGIHRRGELGWIARIQQSLEEGRFVLCRQTCVSLDPAGAGPPQFEILLRMVDSAGRLLMPMTFIPAAERYGLMPQIDRWVIAAALDKLAATGTPPRGEICCINLSGASISDEALPDFVRERVEASGVRPEDVCFEITETAAIANLAHAESLISDIRNLGCRVALDDFGSGMSSFSYLKHLPLDYLKIDGTFVKHMDRDPIDRAMVAAINDIGHVMGIETIAEYVENQATVDMLVEMGVNYAQGYWIEKPQVWH